MGLPPDPVPESIRNPEKSRGDRSQVKLGRYEIVRELGKGAMGIVYLAKDPLIGRLVALKTIRPAAHSDDDEAREFQQRFIREAQAAGILNHAAIVTVFDIGQDEASGTSFIAMEYVEGHNLKDVLAQGRPLTFDQIGDLIAQVAEGLDFAHAKGIVHRDVKPANIILIEGNRAKITDFGIAKIASGAANLTTTGQFLGTPNYMAPEQIKGAPVDGRTDIFSLGICLYECLTRRKPFGGDSLTSISYKIVHEAFPPLRDANPQIPDGFEDVVAKALAKEPAKRYQRARDMSNALRAVIRGERPVHVEPMQIDETVITRDKIPTVELPFPEAAEVSSSGENLGTQAIRTPAAASVPVAAKSAAARPVSAAPVAGGQPLLRRRIPPAVFLAICGVLLVGLIATVLALRIRQVPPRPVDTRAEAQRARERQLRTQANDLVTQGRVADAYDKYLELSRIAPKSPAVTDALQKLGAIRQQEETNKQQVVLAKQKFDQGVALFNQKNYAAAIPLLEESFHLNPNSDAAASYLKFAQQEQLRLETERAAARAAARAPATATTAAVVPATGTAPKTSGTADVSRNGNHAASGAPALLVTTFTPPVADGYMTVKIGSQMILRDNLWEERRRIIMRRFPKPVAVTSQLTPVNADVEIWIVIPQLGIQEHKVIARQVFRPGETRKLAISFNAQAKTFDYTLN